MECALLRLPLEVFDIIGDQLQTPELIRLAACSRGARELVLRESGAWRAKCERVIPGVEPEPWHQADWARLWINVLEPYGDLLGLWSSKDGPYGSFLSVTARAPKILASSVLANRVTDALNTVPVFEVGFQAGGRVSKLCCRSMIPLDQGGHQEGDEDCGPHEADIVLNETGFRLTCCEDCGQDRFERRNRKVALMNRFVQDSNDADEAQHQRIHSFYFHYLNESLTFDLWLAEVGKRGLPDSFADFRKLPRLSGGWESGTRLPLGIYKGSYASHGVEFVLIHREGDRLVATKITGDPHIWAGSVTFRLELSSEVREEENFVVPEGVAWREGTSDQWEDLTTVSKMAGEGQIAQFGYKDPQFVPVSVYVFDRGGEGQPQRFGVHWLSLEGLSIFERLESEDIEKATHLMNSIKLEL